MVIGTHRDHITTRKAKAVLQSLQSACDDAALGDLIVLIDNSTAGKGKVQEDKRTFTYLCNRLRLILHSYGSHLGR